MGKKKHITIGKPEYRGKGWWIPPCHPHYEIHMGPYKYKGDAEEDRAGVEDLINSLPWRVMLLEEQEDE